MTPACLGAFSSKAIIFVVAIVLVEGPGAALAIAHLVRGHGICLHTCHTPTLLGVSGAVHQWLPVLNISIYNCWNQKAGCTGCSHQAGSHCHARACNCLCQPFALLRRVQRRMRR
eukprot:366212-Chlamydomonas_euryale.AAC.52